VKPSGDHPRHPSREWGAGKAIALAALANFALPLSALLMAPVLARGLGVDGRGQLAAATASALLIVTLVAFGIPEATTYFIARRQVEARDVLLRSMVLLTVAGGAGTVTLLLVSPALSGGDDFLESLLRLAAIAIIPTTLVAGIRAVAAGEGRWGLVNGEKYITAAARLAGIGVLALTDNLTVMVGTATVLAAPLIGAVAYLPLAGHRTPESASPPNWAAAPLPTFAAVTSYGGRVWIGAVAGVLLMRLDQVLLAPLAGAVQLGLYAVAVSVAEVVLIANNAVRDVIFAADATQPDDKRLQQSARLSLLVSLAMAFPLGLTAAWWLPLLFGEAFVGAVPVVLLLLFASVASVPGSVAGAGLSARGDPGLRSLSLVLALVVNLSALLVLVPSNGPPGGAIGAGLATLLALVTFTSSSLILLARRHQVASRPFFRLEWEDLRTLWRVVTLIRNSH
jgi:O-antigen/teichoic acid export membrane protein